MKITIVAGARPNFMKVASIIHAFEESKVFNKSFSYRLVHTGQHYDKNMSDNFFHDLNIPSPHANLKCSGSSQSEQTASIMIGFEKELFENPAD
jgi:UDP-N-acetylglucosamine 2-epimerase (non-hydrolysing)